VKDRSFMKIPLVIASCIAMKIAVSRVIFIGVTFFLQQSGPSQVTDFPSDFKFGAASSAYQIEGAWNEDGKSPSIWDAELHAHPEMIADGSNADVGADSYHFYGKDIEALKQVGVRLNLTFK